MRRDISVTVNSPWPVRLVPGQAPNTYVLLVDGPWTGGVQLADVQGDTQVPDRLEGNASASRNGEADE